MNFTVCFLNNMSQKFIYERNAFYYFEAARYMALRHEIKSINSKSATLLFSIGGCVQYFTTIRRLGNKFGNVSSLRA